MMKKSGYWIGLVGVLLLGGIMLGGGQRALDMLAGRTVYAALGFWIAALLGGGVGIALTFGCRQIRKLPGWGAVIALLALAVWLAVLLGPGGGWLQKGWRHFLLSANRSFGMYLWMIAKTGGAMAFIPAMLAGIMIIRNEELGIRNRLLGGGVLLCGYLLGGGLPPLGGALSSDGVFGRLSTRDSGFSGGVPDAVRATGGGHVLTVYKDPDYLGVVALDGRALMFGNRFVATRTLTGYVPLLAGPPRAGKVALVVALAGGECGVYLPFFFRWDTRVVAAGQGGVVEALAEMDTALAGETRVRNEKLGIRDPFREKGYDIIFVAPEPGWVRGSGGAYKRGALMRYRDALAEGGVVALRIDGRALSEARFASVARDFLSVFEGVQVWCMGTTDWLLLGGRQEIRVAMDDMLELFERDDVFHDWMRAGNMGLPEILACMVCDRGGLEKWIESRGAEGARAAAWRAPRRVIEGDHFLALMMESARREGGTDWVLQGEMDEAIYEGMMRRVEEARDARALAVRALTESYAGRPEESLAAAKAAAKVTPRDAILQQVVDHLDLDAQRLLKIRNYKGGRTCFEHLVALSGGGARYHHGLGICLRATGDLENAYRHFARAVGGAPEQVAFRLDLAQAAAAVGEFAEADRQYREVLKREPDNAEVHLMFAQALTSPRRTEKDFEQAIQLAERACALTAWDNDALAYGLADIYIEAGRVLEGVGLKRKLKEK